MVSLSQAKESFRLLYELYEFLGNRKESRLRRQIEGIIAELTDVDGNIDPAGFENARQEYNRLLSIKGGFQEYNIWMDDEDERIAINKKIDDLRANLWNALNDV